MQRLYTVLIVCLAGVAAAVDVYVPETWPDSSLRGWRCMDQAVALPGTNYLSVTDGVLQMEPEAAGPLDPRWSFVAGAAASGGRFTGSYYDAGVHALSLRLHSSCSATMTVELVNDADFIIYNAALEVAAETEEITLPVSTNTFQPDFFASGSFECLLRNVDDIWITFEWSTAVSNPVFAVDDVMLTGAGPGYGAWIDAFSNITNSALRLSGADADGDGISNADEFFADSLPDVSNRPFAVSVLGNGVEWNSSTNCRYTVLRATNLVSQTFVPVRELDGSGTVTRFIDPDAPSKAFYKITVRRK